MLCARARRRSPYAPFSGMGAMRYCFARERGGVRGCPKWTPPEDCSRRFAYERGGNSLRCGFKARCRACGGFYGCMGVSFMPFEEKPAKAQRTGVLSAGRLQGKPDRNAIDALSTFNNLKVLDNPITYEYNNSREGERYPCTRFTSTKTETGTSLYSNT